MVKLKDKIDQALTLALKAGDDIKLNTLRLVKSAFKNKEIELGKELSDEEAIKILQSQAKQHQDSIKEFEKAGRSALVQKEQQEWAIIKEYLPRALTKEELTEIVVKAIKESGAESVKDLGKVMPLAIKQAKGRADGGRLKDVVLEKLK